MKKKAKEKTSLIQKIARTSAVLLVLLWFTFIILSHGFSFVTLIESVVWIIILTATLIAWRWEPIGGILFMLIGLSYIVNTWDKLSIVTIVSVSGPLILIGCLFILDILIKKKRIKLKI